MNDWAVTKSVFELSWADVLSIIGPDYMKPDYPFRAKNNLSTYIRDVTGLDEVDLNDIDMETVKIHLIALNLLKSEINRPQGGRGEELIMLTDLGHRQLLELKSVRKQV
jgi:hypothetical protein